MYDIIVIGAGVAGYTAAIKAAKSGLKTAIIEPENFGGTCLNTGCIPTKYLISEMHKYNDALSKISNGIYVGNLALDFKKTILQLQEKIITLTSGIEWLLKNNKVDIYQGNAEFIDSEKVFVHTKQAELKAKKIIIATGSKPITMPVIDFADNIERHYFTTDDILHKLEEIPESLAIIGGGAVGLEYAFIYAGFGCKVTIIEQRETLFSEMDSDIDKEVMKMLFKKNIRVELGCEIDSIFNGKSDIVIIDKNENEISRTSALLFAMGRKPNIAHLKLEKADIEVTNGIICTNDLYQTNCKNIFAIGDVNGKQALAYTAIAQAENVISYIKEIEFVKDMNIIPVCVFLEQELSFVGLMEDKAKSSGIDVKTSKFLMSANGRSQVDGNGGFIKIIADQQTGIILGGICICHNSSELITYVSFAIKNKMTLSEFSSHIFPHPTYSEALLEAVNLVNNDSVYMI